jgi:hypothetical protein
MPPLKSVAIAPGATVLCAQAPQRLAHASDEVIERPDVARVERQGDSLGTRLASEPGDLFGFRTIGVVREDRMDATLGEAEHGAAPEAAASARDDRDGG